MKLVISLALLAVSQARVIEPGCEVISIHNINYEKEILKDNVLNPYQMVIDYDTDTLFFSYTASSKDTSDFFKSAYLNLKTNEYNTIPGITGGFAAAVDKKNHNVYLGGKHGIHKYDYDTHKAININPEGHSIWQMFFKDKLYYTTYPDEKAYTFTLDGISTKVPGLEDTRALLVAIDINNILYFSNSSGLFCYKNQKYIDLGDYTPNSFTQDINGNLYFSTPDGLFNIDNYQRVKKLADITNVYGLVVEGTNNFIYAVENCIIRLKPTKKRC